MNGWDAGVFIIVSLLVIAGAYYATYWIAKHGRRIQARRGAGSGMRVLESMTLGKDRQVCALEINGRVYVVAFSGNGAALLAEFALEDYKKSAGADRAGALGGMQIPWPWKKKDAAKDEDRFEDIYRKAGRRDDEE